MLEDIQELVIKTIRDLDLNVDNSILENLNISTRLYGSNGILDSLGLVALVTDLEDAIYVKFSKSVVLADEKAMSQQTSPFRSIGSLSEYIMKVINE
ncbi:hypothetical protein [Campylobacter concisus]|uniref:hypothetical protein n=1 Tax=Campylobacter concisus TaxID=199 RepID=UPI000CD9F221|nr:hypothetical protein [Campylobacter concisus]